MGLIVIMNVLIFGSCVSRDILSHSAKSKSSLVLVDYFARSSFASLVARSAGEVVISYLDRIPSAFQRRMVERDLKKSFLTSIEDLDFDCLLVDFIDERFNVWFGADGTVCTLSSEFVQTGFLDEIGGGRVVFSGSDEFWENWLLGWSAFVNKLRSVNKLDKIIINKVFWSKNTVGGRAFGRAYSERRIFEANEFLEKIYARVEQDIPNCQFVMFSNDQLRAADVHKWGLSPFHYVDEYYEVALGKIIARVSGVWGKSFPGLWSEGVCNNYDATQWKFPIHDYENVSVINSKLWSDGIHRVSMGGGQTLDFLFYNSAMLRKEGSARFLLVGLSGAVSGRKGKKAPFFSGLNISRSLGLPLISVSDPSLILDGDLSLAWYAGNEGVLDLPNKIAEILNKISRDLNCDLIVFGGSGGGYCALSMADLLERQLFIFVWNPQTAICDYVPEFVVQYIEKAFPSYCERARVILSHPQQQQAKLLYDLLNECGIRHDVRKIAPSKNSQILIIQNRSDWHVLRHIKPYMSERQWSCIGNSSYVEKIEGRIGVYFGDWGVGHAAPSKNFIEFIIARTLKEVGISSLLAEIDAGVPSVVDSSQSFQVLDDMVMPVITASASVGANAVYANCVCSRSVSTDRFAFYLLRNGERIAMRWYESSKSAVFNVDGSLDGLEVVAFMRDHLGGQISSRVFVDSSSV